MKRVLLTSAALFACASMFAVSYKNNTYQKLANEYSKKAQNAIDAGEYELSIEYSQEVEKNSLLSKEYVQKMIARDGAEDAMKEALDRITVAKKNPDRVDAKLILEAEKTYASATVNFNKDTEAGYMAAIDDSNKIIESLSSIDDLVKLAQVETARKNAIRAKADKYYPELLAAFDAEREDLGEYKDEGKAEAKKAYIESLDDLISKYKSLERASIAQALKEKINSLSKKSAASSELRRADAELAKYAALSPTKSGKEFYAQADKAYQIYDDVMSENFAEVVTQEKEDALKAKKLAESEKAQVYSKTRPAYEEAADLYRTSDTKLKNQKTEEAYNGYKSAKDSYMEQYETAKKERMDAMSILKAAEDAVAESKAYAIKADSIIPLKKKIEGIADENEKMLEDYSFADPKDLIIDLSDKPKVEAATSKNEVEASKNEVKASKNEVATEPVKEEPKVQEDKFIDAK